MDLEIGVVVIGLARQQRLDLTARHLAREPLDRGFGVGDDQCIAVRFAELDQLDVVGKLVLGALHR